MTSGANTTRKAVATKMSAVTVRRSVSSRRRASACCRAATLRASVGNVTVHTSSATSIGSCATFCA